MGDVGSREEGGFSGAPLTHRVASRPSDVSQPRESCRPRGQPPHTFLGNTIFRLLHPESQITHVLCQLSFAHASNPSAKDKMTEFNEISNRGAIS